MARQRQEEENKRKQQEALARSLAQATEDRKKMELVRERLERQLASYNPEQLLTDVRSKWGVGKIIRERYLHPQYLSIMQVSLAYEYPEKAGGVLYNRHGGGKGGGNTPIMSLLIL